MSLVVFPFTDEDPSTLISNIRTAAEHPSIRHVLAIGLRQNRIFTEVCNALDNIRTTSEAEIDIILQDRLGNRRSGKGDAMNTGLHYFLSRTSLGRIHFYDADITSFSADWISKAECAADAGCDVVKHYYPRARCDAMITWMITRPGFAILWPRTYLSQIHQPLGGELLVSRKVASQLLADSRVREQSDWGIDTMYTFAFAAMGCDVHEVYMEVGKQHRLYGSLSELKTMLIECFTTIKKLQTETVRPAGSLTTNACTSIPDAIRHGIGFDIEATLGLLMENWTSKQEDYLREHFPEIAPLMLLNQRRSTFKFMNSMIWFYVYRKLLRAFISDDVDWQELLFKLWLTRVLNYVTTTAIRGFDFSLLQLQREIGPYRERQTSVISIPTPLRSLTSCEN